MAEPKVFTASDMAFAIFFIEQVAAVNLLILLYCNRNMHSLFSALLFTVSHAAYLLQHWISPTTLFGQIFDNVFVFERIIVLILMLFGFGKYKVIWGVLFFLTVSNMFRIISLVRKFYHPIQEEQKNDPVIYEENSIFYDSEIYMENSELEEDEELKEEEEEEEEEERENYDFLPETFPYYWHCEDTISENAVEVFLTEEEKKSENEPIVDVLTSSDVEFIAKVVAENKDLTAKLEFLYEILEQHDLEEAEWDSERHRLETETKYLNEKLHEINNLLVSQLENFNNMEATLAACLEETNRAAQLLEAAQKKVEQSDSRNQSLLFENWDLCGHIYADSKSKQRLSALVHEYEEKFRLLEEEKCVLTAKLKAAECKADTYKTLLHDL